MATPTEQDEPKCVDLTAQDDDDDTVAVDQDEEADDTEADACCICQDVVRLVQQGFLPCCDHRFHFDCIVTWSKVTNLCPLCKLQFNNVERKDADGAVVHRESIADTKQIFRPDPRDHDVQAQLQLVNNVRCEACGRGDDEHVLLMCEAPLCMNASHTYCVGLGEVPAHAWYCSLHEGGPQRASDLLARPASTVSSRRRTRRLATLMSNVMGGVGATRRRLSAALETSASRGRRRGRGRLTMPDGDALDLSSGRPIRGVALSYAVHMSRELQAIQQRADAMFARGELGTSTLYAPPRGSLLGSRSTPAARSEINDMWEDRARSQRQLEAAARLSGDAQSPPRSARTSPNKLTPSFADEFRDLAKRMADAASHDNYASSVSLTIPKTARLRLVTSVTAFFAKLNDREKVAALDAGCLGLLFAWVQVGRLGDGSGEGSATMKARDLHPHVLEAVLAALEGLPVRKEDLDEVQGFRDELDDISSRSDISLTFRERCILLSEKWRAINPPPASTATVITSRASSHTPHTSTRGRESTPSLPPIQSFAAVVPTTGRSSGKRKASHPSDDTVKKTTKQAKQEWESIAVDYVKAKLYPLYKDSKGKMSKDQFKIIVKQVIERFRSDAARMQSAILENGGDQLTSIAKQRLMQLLDQVYRASRASTTSTSTTVAARTRAIALTNSTYSATPASASMKRARTS